MMRWRGLGEVEAAKVLLDWGAEINAQHIEGGSTPLHYAVTTNRLEMVELLLSRGANVNATFRSGSTALHIAANRGFVPIAEVLIRKGALVDARDASGAAPIDEAAWRGYAEMVQFLIDHGADPKAHNRDNGATPLHEAAMKGHTEVIEVLIKAGASLDARDNAGATPLDEAIRAGYIRSAELLLDKGGRLPGGKITPRTLHDAIMKGQRELVALLIEKGIDVRTARFEGFTPLHAAAMKGYPDIVALLLAKGVDVNARSGTGGTPLHDAALGGSAEVARILLDKGADIEARESESGSTPLHVAASWGRVAVVKLLLERGASKTVRNKAGKTPLDRRCGSRLRRRGGTAALDCSSILSRRLFEMIHDDGFDRALARDELQAQLLDRRKHRGRSARIGRRFRRPRRTGSRAARTATTRTARRSTHRAHHARLARHVHHVRHRQIERDLILALQSRFVHHGPVDKRRQHLDESPACRPLKTPCGSGRCSCSPWSCPSCRRSRPPLLEVRFMVMFSPFTVIVAPCGPFASLAAASSFGAGGDVRRLASSHIGLGITGLLTSLGFASPGFD